MSSFFFFFQIPVWQDFCWYLFNKGRRHRFFTEVKLTWHWWRWDEAGWRPGHSHAASAAHSQCTSSHTLTSWFYRQPQHLFFFPYMATQGCFRVCAGSDHDLILFSFPQKNPNTTPFEALNSKAWWKNSRWAFFHPSARICFCTSPRQLHAPAAPCRTSGRC